MGFLTLFPSYYEQRKKRFPNLVAFAFVLLNFRLWFCMGVNKFYFPQPSWTHFRFWYFSGTAHAPPAARWFHQLPLVFKQSAVAALSLPDYPRFLGFGSRKFGLIAFVTFTLTSVLIQLAGNYGYFNLLSIITGVLVLKWLPMYPCCDKQLRTTPRTIENEQGRQIHSVLPDRFANTLLPSCISTPTLRRHSITSASSSQTLIRRIKY